MIYDEKSIRNLKIVSAQKSSGRLVEINFPEEFFILSSTFSIYQWSSIEKIYMAVSGKYGYSYNDIGFTFPSEAEEWGEIIEGIKIYNPMGEIFLTEGAFLIFASKYFSALVLYAKNSADSINKVSWWSGFLSFTTNLEQKVKSEVF